MPKQTKYNGKRYAVKEKNRKPLRLYETKRVLRKQIKWLREDVQSLRELHDYNEVLNDVIARLTVEKERLVTENGNLRQRLLELSPHKGFLCVGVEEVNV